MTLTEQEINAILAEVKYKPGSRFFLDRWSYHGANLGIPLHGHSMLCLEVVLPDVVTGQKTHLVFRNSAPFEPEDAEEVLALCRRTAWLWEQHEADEWLTYQGAKPFDPHEGEQTALMRRQLSNLDQLVAEMQHYSMLTMDRQHQAQQVALNLADDDLAKRPPVRPQTQGFLDELKDSLSRNRRGHQ